jgi:hypothetical protein
MSGRDYRLKLLPLIAVGAYVCLRLGSCAFPTPLPGHRGPVVHSYTLEIQDIDGNAIDSARIACKSYNGEAMVSDSIYLSNSDGKATVDVLASPDSSTGYTNVFETRIVFTVSKNGFFPRTDSLRNVFTISNLSSNPGIGSRKKSATIQLYKLTDYIDTKNAIDSSTATTLLAFVDSLFFQQYLPDSYLEARSIVNEQEEGRGSIRFGFHCTTVFNSDVLKPFDIVSILFRTEVMKLLGPVRRIADIPSFENYTFLFHCTSLSFNHPESDAQHSEYEFTLGEPAFRNLKDVRADLQRAFDSTRVMIDRKLYKKAL